jgi:hypothetical protein
MCAGSSVVTGIYGRSGSVVDALGVHCATIDVVGSAPNSYTISLDNPTTLGPWGGAGGSPYDNPCPPGYVVGAWGGSAGIEIDSIQITCYPVALTLR